MMTEADRKFIERVRGLHADASVDWAERIEGDDHFLDARLIPQAPRSVVLAFDLYADPRDIAFLTVAHRAVGVLLRARDEAIDYFRRQNPKPEAVTDEQQEEEKPFSFAQNCAIYCGKRWFQRYMFEVHGLEHAHDATRMRTKIHSLLAISSRTELDADEAARDRWQSLRAHAKAWKDMKL